MTENNNDTPNICLGASVYYMAAQEDAQFSSALVTSQGVMAKFAEFAAEELQSLYSQNENDLQAAADQISTKNSATQNEMAQNNYNQLSSDFSHWQNTLQGTVNTDQSGVDGFSTALQQVASNDNAIIGGYSTHMQDIIGNI